MKNSLFEKNIITTWGEKGQTWLRQLPEIIETLAKQWHLSQLQTVENLSYNYVMKGFQKNTPIVVKIGCDHDEIKKEMKVLKAYSGDNCVQVLASNLTHGALLLEQAIPGTSLVHLYPHKDDEAIAYTVHIMQSLHKAIIPYGKGISIMPEWFKDLSDPPMIEDMYHINKAQIILKRLLNTQTASNVLLHGDLHHDNIVLSARGWIAIDPKGIIGDPAFEVCAFLKNPHPEQLKSQELNHHRLNQFSAMLSIDTSRIHAWMYVSCVLNACWAIKEGKHDSACFDSAKQWECDTNKIRE